MSKHLLIFAVILGLAGTQAALAQVSNSPIPTMPKLLTQREQMDVRERWLMVRLGSRLLPMMKRHDVDMWIVVNEEFNADPVTPHITPPIPIVGRRDVFIFIDKANGLNALQGSYDEND